MNRLTIIIASVVVVGIFSSKPVLAHSDPKSDILREIQIEQETTNIYRAYYPDKNTARKAAITFHSQIHEANHEQGYLILELSDEEIEQLKNFGFKIKPAPDFIHQRNIRLQSIRERIERDAGSPGALIEPLTIPGYACYETVEETLAEADAMVASNPNIAEFVDVGNSWRKNQGLGGFDIKVLKLTNKANTGPKPILFINSAIHAREYTTAPLNLAFAKWLFDGYQTNADATWILDHHEVHLMLQTNPDGRKQAETGISWRKNTNQNYCSPTSNSRGADLNRNFSFSWNSTGGSGSSGNQCNSTYRGPSAGSEPETQAIESYVRSIFPDRRGPNVNDAAPLDTSGIHIDIHSFSELVLWPWGNTNNPAPNGSALATLGRKFAFYNDYFPQQSVGLYPTDGTSDNVSYGELGVAAYTFELGTSFFQSCSVYQNSILPDNLPALIYAAKVVRTPYITPGGPDITGLTLSGAASSSGVPAGTLVNLSASSSDLGFNNQNGTEATQNIVAAEYYIDIPPWQAGAIANGLNAGDGSFNQKTETLTGSIDTSQLTNGRYTVFVRAQDASGTWGAVSAVFLVISDEPPPPSSCPVGSVNFNSLALTSYSNQNNTNDTAVGDNGDSVTLTGNTWVRSTQAFNITPNTVIDFNFASSSQGEIHAIGFDENDTLNDAPRHFQFWGTQNWTSTGKIDLSPKYSGNGASQSYSIPIGQSYTGNMFLVLTNDKDSGTLNNTSQFSCVNIYETTPSTCEVEESFESGLGGWTTSGSCSTGTFTTGSPDQVNNGGVLTQLSGAQSGAAALFTQPNSGGAGSDDVDGGECIATSPVYNVSANSTGSIFYFHGQRDAGDDPNDGFNLEVSINGGSYQSLVSIGDETSNAAWTQQTFNASANDTIQLRVRAADGAGPGDLVEAGIDNLKICAD
ncbi:hypothetical protein FLL45_14935 [Aliikangiella marina]|uniref:Peptidase M14 domain-containing protein n=1 Tax=Aliikangiella marina TaxID=1712262 RepID=A0A545T6F8_9GAMM|nr:M14 family metallopeptidase [Aliikangiella marina]TQV72765.1 hypothetical protein FLL45_14935 [Aliikangiella marina]